MRAQLFKICWCKASSKDNQRLSRFSRLDTVGKGSITTCTATFTPEVPGMANLFSYRETKVAGVLKKINKKLYRNISFLYVSTDAHKTNNKLFTIVEHTEGEQPVATHKCCDSLEFPVAHSSLELGTSTL